MEGDEELVRSYSKQKWIILGILIGVVVFVLLAASVILTICLRQSDSSNSAANGSSSSKIVTIGLSISHIQSTARRRKDVDMDNCSLEYNKNLSMHLINNINDPKIFYQILTFNMSSYLSPVMTGIDAIEFIQRVIKTADTSVNQTGAAVQYKLNLNDNMDNQLLFFVPCQVILNTSNYYTADSITFASVISETNSIMVSGAVPGNSIRNSYGPMMNTTLIGDDTNDIVSAIIKSLSLPMPAIPTEWVTTVFSISGSMISINPTTPSSASSAASVIPSMKPASFQATSHLSSAVSSSKTSSIGSATTIHINPRNTIVTMSPSISITSKPAKTQSSRSQPTTIETKILIPSNPLLTGVWTSKPSSSLQNSSTMSATSGSSGEINVLKTTETSNTQQAILSVPMVQPIFGTQSSHFTSALPSSIGSSSNVTTSVKTISGTQITEIQSIVSSTASTIQPQSKVPSNLSTDMTETEKKAYRTTSSESSRSVNSSGSTTMIANSESSSTNTIALSTKSSTQVTSIVSSSSSSAGLFSSSSPQPITTTTESNRATGTITTGGKTTKNTVLTTQISQSTVSRSNGATTNSLRSPSIFGSPSPPTVTGRTLSTSQRVITSSSIAFTANATTQMKTTATTPFSRQVSSSGTALASTSAGTTILIMPSSTPTPLPSLNCVFMLDFGYLGDPSLNSSAQQYVLLFNMKSQLFFGAMEGAFGSSPDGISIDYLQEMFYNYTDFYNHFNQSPLVNFICGVDDFNDYILPNGSDSRYPKSDQSCLVIFSGINELPTPQPTDKACVLDTSQYNYTLLASIDNATFNPVPGSTVVPINSQYTQNDVETLVNAILESAFLSTTSFP